jgi:hypothetical protein
MIHTVISLSKIKVYSAVMLFLAIDSMISPAEAAASCSSSSPPCCWAVRVWQLLGKSTSVTSSSSTACCRSLDGVFKSSGVPGVYCNSSGAIWKIDWIRQSLTAAIPSDIGKITSLTFL